MRIRGPYPLFNPLSVGELGLQGIGTALQVYNAYNQGKAMDFAQHAALTGEPATSLPGGAIRHFLSTVTGGAIDPNEEINGQGAIAQNTVLGQQQKQKLDEVKTLASARQTLGPNSFQPGTPLGDASKKLGLDLSGQTPIEQYRNKETELREQSNQTQQQGLRLRQENMQREQSNADRQYRLSLQHLNVAEAGLARQNRLLQDEETRMSPAYQQSEAANRITGTAGGIDKLTLPQYRNRTGKAYVDANSLTINNDPTTTVAQASRNLNLKPVKEGVPLDAINDTKTQIQSLEKLITPDKNGQTLVDKVYPSAGTTNKTAGAIEGVTTGISNILNRNDPNVQAFRRAGVEMDGYLKRMTGRFPGAQLYQQQIDELIPNPGMVGLHPTFRPYTADVATTMIKNTIQSLKEHAVDNALNESRSNDEAEDATTAANMQ
jgi:hypothetical protein